MEMTTVVFGVGLVLGSAMIGTVCMVYFKKQVMGFGGSVLTIFGVVLVGLSVWSTVQVRVSKEGLEVELDKLAQRVGHVEETAIVVAEGLASVATNAETDRRQFNTLSRELAESEVLRPEAARVLEVQPDRIMRVDPERLREMSEVQRRMAIERAEFDGP